MTQNYKIFKQKKVLHKLFELLMVFISEMALKKFGKIIFTGVQLKFHDLFFNNTPARLLYSLEISLKLKNLKPSFLYTDNVLKIF